MKEVKPITITYPDGKEYKLEFTRETVLMAEEDGFTPTEITSKPMTRIPQLFYFAFKKNHPDITREETDAILTEDLGGITGKMGSKLAELYSSAFDYVTRKDGTEPKNPKVKVKL